jgi:hypothetical protein
MTTVVALAAIVVAGCFVYYWVTSANKRPKGEFWFYDLKTKQLFTASDLSVPPIDTKSGPDMGVRAYVYTCDADPKSTNRFIAYRKVHSGIEAGSRGGHETERWPSTQWDAFGPISRWDFSEFARGGTLVPQ